MILLENNKILLTINLAGGSYSDFHLKELALNPFNWEIEDKTMPPFKGHFVCFDRWGPPSEGERLNGFRHHGEVNTQNWELLDTSSTSSTMLCTLPVGNLELTRHISLIGEESAFLVTEKIKNLNKYGRMFNIVQHATIAPPFLDKTTLFDNNTDKGFEDKEDGSLHQEEPVFYWPEAIHQGERINLRQFQDPCPRVSSFVYNQKEVYGWVTASSPAQQLMLGYLWKIEEYPWINFWRSMENGIPAAFGMEFGTTGLHEAFPVIAKKGKIFGRNIYDFIDANEVISKSFICFMAKIPTDYKGVGEIHLNDSELRIKEKSKTPREIYYPIPEHTLKQFNGSFMRG